MMRQYAVSAITPDSMPLNIVSRDVKSAGATFQVIVACATCGPDFAALSRN